MPHVLEVKIAGQPSWLLRSDSVEMAVTQLGAHMAPVIFYRNSRHPVQPYYSSPWQGEKISLEPGQPEIPLRGDFFCMPFGRDKALDAPEKHPQHGETSCFPWLLLTAEERDGIHSCTLSLDTQARSGHVTRAYHLVDGENVVYDCTTIHGFAGPVTFAHHAILRSPEQEDTLLISSSPIQFGLVYPTPMGDPGAGEYQSLKIGAEFACLQQVPSIFKHLPDQDCSAYPARRGFCDLVQVVQTGDTSGLAWTAAVNTVEGYVWFSVKNLSILPSLIIWMENHGRHNAPWNGRNCALGLEDACSFFDQGIRASTRPNALSLRGMRTHHVLGANAFEVRYLQGVLKTPAGFGRVSNCVIAAQEITFESETGGIVSGRIQAGFLHGESLMPPVE